MPHFTSTLTNGSPIIDIIVGASAPRFAALQKAGLTAPSPQTVRGLIDTGASCTCIDPQVFSTLGLQPTGSAPVFTPSTGAVAVQQALYDVSVMISNGNRSSLIIPSLPVLESELLLGQGFHVLVGRDILSQCILIYDGSSGLFTLSY